MIDEDFCAFLVNLVAEGIPVQEGYISEDKPHTRVWFGKSGATHDVLLDGSPALSTWNYSVEVHSLDPATAIETADAIRRGLNGTNLGGKACGVFVEDADDDYEFRGIDSRDNYEGAAVLVQVITL